VRFPTIAARDLEGRRYDVPDDLPAGTRIVVLAFQRWQTALVERWQPALEALVHAHPGVTWWEVAALSRVYTPAREYIDGGMRGGIPDPEARRRTLTSYTDLHALATALAIPSFEDIYVVVVGPDGEVLRVEPGGCNGERLSQVTAAVEGSASPPSSGDPS
jgi:hypothetical protein